LKNSGLSISAYPTPIVLLLTTEFFAFHTCSTGMPYIGELGSSKAEQLTISLAPTTSDISVFSKSWLISVNSYTESYGIATSANITFNWPGILPATGCIANLNLIPFLVHALKTSLIPACAWPTANP